MTLLEVMAFARHTREIQSALCIDVMWRHEK